MRTAPADRAAKAGTGYRRRWARSRADRFYTDQVLDHPNAAMREFAERREMFFLFMADARGECDSTFRAGPAGFVRVLGVSWARRPLRIRSAAATG